jgi:hypothetical protein
MRPVRWGNSKQTTATRAHGDTEHAQTSAQKETAARENVRPLTMVEGGLESISQSAGGVTVSSEHAVRRPFGAAASAATSNQLAWLNEVWSSLPEDARETMLNIARKATRGEVATLPAVDQAGAGPFSTR